LKTPQIIKNIEKNKVKINNAQIKQISSTFEDSGILKIDDL